ncbi:Maf-like protein [Citrus sinensis]|uniref:Maf-like protein n=1 Tax=Citrus sinensis TaxID=2711 RepID=A0ACB8KWR5_CITSI|nr:Maf-like protein [Citrus sinensis]
MTKESLTRPDSPVSPSEFRQSLGNMEASATPVKIILGSSSMPRRKILAEMGYEFSVMAADIDEKSIRKEKPEDLVMAIAEAKAAAIISKLQITDSQLGNVKQTILIVADTAEAILNRLPIGDYIKEAEPTILITGVIREKPSSREEARRFIKDYSGGQCATVSSVLVTNLKTGFRKGEWDRVEIQFHEIPDEVIEKLIEEGIVLNVAGGLIIEHSLILPYVKQVVGAMDSVMGLPKAVTEKLIKEAL